MIVGIALLVTLTLLPGTSSAGVISDILGPQLYGLVGSQLGWAGFGSYASQLGSYYRSLPRGTVCSYAYCNTYAVQGAINSRNLWSSFARSLFERW